MKEEVERGVLMDGARRTHQTMIEETHHIDHIITTIIIIVKNEEMKEEIDMIDMIIIEIGTMTMMMIENGIDIITLHTMTKIVLVVVINYLFFFYSSIQLSIDL